MRVVNDTNVVVSAALKNRTPEEVILFIAGQEDFEMDCLTCNCRRVQRGAIWKPHQEVDVLSVPAA